MVVVVVVVDDDDDFEDDDDDKTGVIPTRVYLPISVDFV